MKHYNKIIIQKINKNQINKFKIKYCNYYKLNRKNKKMKIKYQFFKIITKLKFK